ncbi:MAG: gliding motility protein GldM [Flavobacteriaceae bacterium]
MAGGKLTPRQKMINLMYLIFIAMLALNMSKEVLSAFGLFNEKFELSNANAMQTNAQIMDALNQKASDDPSNFKKPKEVADKVVALTKDFYNYVEELKSSITDGVELDEKTGKLPYEAMDKADAIDYTWFKGDGLTEKGQEIVATIDKYREDMKVAIGTDKKYSPIVADLETKFNTDDVNVKGMVKPMSYLDYHYKGFPGIASLTKLSAMQSDAKTAESNVLNALIGNTAIAQASMSNYKAIVVLDKNAFYQGEQVTGRVVLGRYDESTIPTDVKVNAGTASIENGQAVFSIGAGSVGEHDITGEFTFMEDGKPIPIKIEGQYVVVPKPNSANISADKMNVVYIGVDNPMTISFAGISDNNVTATAPGLSKLSGTGKYNWRPQGGGNEVTVSVTGKLPDGTSVSDKKTFRVKTIPAPATDLRGITGGTKGSKENLINSPVKVKFDDFDFDVKTTVIQFEVKAQGSPIVVCQGNRFSPAAVAAINKVPKGGNVIISNVKTRIEGTNVPIKDSTPFVWEIQ